MEKIIKAITLDKIERVGIWIWRLFMAIVVSALLSYQNDFRNEAVANYNYIKPLIENTSKIVSKTNFQPEIPDGGNNPNQASCPADSNIEYLINHPDEVIAFLEKLDPVLGGKPYLMNLLIAILTSDRTDISNYLQSEYPGGFPNP